MNLDTYRTRMEQANREFSQAVLAMLTAYGQTQTIFNDLLQDVGTAITHLETQQADLRESNEELRRLILEQGGELRALRDRLNDNGGSR